MKSFEKRPDFFIVGAPKCGTTALWHYLQQHPDIFMARKETHFFGSDLDFGRQFFRRDADSYQAEFKNWNNQTRIGESSVWYLFSHKAADEIKSFSPDARIIIMVREPVSMLYSLFYQFRNDKNEHLATFEEALAAENDRREGRRITRLSYFPQGLVYRSTARFTEQIRRYFNAFGRERVHVVIYDDFAADTLASYRDTLKFLEVASNSINISFEPVNTNMSVKSSVLQSVLNDPLVRGTAIAMRNWLPQPVFNVIRKAGTRLSDLNSRPAPRQPLAADTRLSLQKDFAPEIERLSELLGRDLTHWSKPVPPSVGRRSPLVSASGKQAAV